MLKHLKEYSREYTTILTVVLVLCLIGAVVDREFGRDRQKKQSEPVAQAIVEPVVETVVEPAVKAPDVPSDGWTVKEPSQTAEFISGPVAASIGELCVFRLSDSKTYADWCIVPEATCYVDSSGSSLAFSSNNRAKYTILAAIVEDGVPKILTHICEYGLSPQPDPGPTPNPDPTPKPNPPPNLSLREWVSQNVPQAGRHQCAALASCYEATASAIESGSIVTQAAAYSTIRTSSQTKIDLNIWSEFLETLSVKLNTALDGSTDVKILGTKLKEIADGLKAIAEPETNTEPAGNAAVPPQSPSASINPTPVGHLTLNKDQRPTETGIPIGTETPGREPTANWCPDPTGRACQPQPTIQYNRRRVR